MIKFKFEKRDLYHIHASLVPIANMTLLLKLMYDHLKFAIRDTVRYTILLQLPYVTDWPTRIVLNMLLMHSYNFIRGLYEVPPDEPGQTELNEKQISALKMLGLAVVPGQRSLTQFQQRVIKASKFMDFLRNRTSHRMDALNVFASYSPEGSELSSYVCYPLILPHLQDALYDANELSKLDMKSLF
uniref:Uncharacterized protein n=1 Tax=Oryza glumipatula TaxID=40148 RepID=A0A0D9ZAJ9_9ORYZ